MTRSSAAAIARLAQRLGVLLAAGIPPNAAWGYLDEPELASVLAGVNTAAENGRDIAHALTTAANDADAVPALNALAAAWRVATHVGAPLAATLGELAACLRDVAEAEREAALALAGPVSTARLVMALPVVGILFSSVLGFDTLHVLFATGAGLTCLVLGLGLMIVGVCWNRALVRRARPAGGIPGIHFDVLAIAMTGSGSIEAARATATAAMRECGLRVDDGTENVLDFARRAGVPAAQLLRAEANELRREARANARRAVAVLGVRLMIPLGVCVLPAFLLLGIAPLVIAVISSTVTQF